MKGTPALAQAEAGFFMEWLTDEPGG